MVLTVVVLITFLVGGFVGVMCIKARHCLMEAQMDDSHRNHFGKPM